MEKLKAADRRAIRKVAHQVSTFLQRRIYDLAVEELAKRGGVSQDRAADVRACLDAAADAVASTETQHVQI